MELHWGRSLSDVPKDELTTPIRLSSCPCRLLRGLPSTYSREPANNVRFPFGEPARDLQRGGRHEQALLPEEETMRTVSQILFWAGLVAIPVAWLAWYIGPEIEIGREIMGNIADPALRAALQEAHGERWGVFVALWPVTLLVLSSILERKAPRA